MVRIAEYKDLEEIIALYIEALNEIGERRRFEIHPDRVDYSVRKNWNEAPCFVLEADKKIVGFAGFCLAREFFSDSVYLKDYMFFIKPLHRNERNLRLLCNAARHFAAQNNLILQVNYLANDRPKQQQRLMQKMGFNIVGFMGVAE